MLGGQPGPVFLFRTDHDGRAVGSGAYILADATTDAKIGPNVYLPNGYLLSLVVVDQDLTKAYGLVGHRAVLLTDTTIIAVRIGIAPAAIDHGRSDLECLFFLQAQGFEGMGGAYFDAFAAVVFTVAVAWIDHGCAEPSESGPPHIHLYDIGGADMGTEAATQAAVQEVHFPEGTRRSEVVLLLESPKAYCRREG